MVFMLLMAALLTGCASTQLSEAFVKEEVTAQSKAAVEELLAGEYEKVCDRMTEEMKALVTPETLQENMNIMNPATGSFKEYKSVSVIGQTDSKTKQEMAVVVIVASFEKKKVTYTITFDTDMKIMGFYMK